LRLRYARHGIIEPGSTTLTEATSIRQVVSFTPALPRLTVFGLCLILLRVVFRFSPS